MFMENNLDNMILASGMTKTRVAEEKGITAQNLSRVIHGKTRLNIQDAEEYSKILGCSTQEVMFKSEGIPILGYVFYNKDGTVEYDFLTERSEGKKLSKATATRQVKNTSGDIFVPGFYTQQVGAIQYQMDPTYKGPWLEYNGAWSIVDRTPMMEGTVPEAVFQRPAFVKAKGKSIQYGHVYPEPGATYTIYNPWRQNDLLGDVQMDRGIELEWAVPLITTHWNADLRGISVKQDM